MSKYFEYIRERTSDWLTDFVKERATSELKTVEADKKSADYLSNILDVVSKNKFNSIEAKIEDLKRRVGVNMISIEKSADEQGVAEKTASVMPLSIRHKVAIDENSGDKLKLDAIKIYISETIENRNGHITTPALLDMVSNMFSLNHEWLEDHLDEIKNMITKAFKEFSPKHYKSNISPSALAKSDKLTSGNEAQDDIPIAQPAHH